MKHNNVIKSIIEFATEEEKDNVGLALKQLNNIPGYKSFDKLNPLSSKVLIKPLTKEELMMNQIVKKLGTSFATPE
jgi:hypothetical protein